MNKKLMLNGNLVEVSGGVTLEQVEQLMDGKLSAVQGQEVYSTGETRIGTWMDGKPLYRRVFSTTSPSAAKVHTKIPESKVENIDQAVSITGILYNKNVRCYSSIPYNDGNNAILANYGFADTTLSASGEGVYLYATTATFLNLSVWIVLEYTKTTD